MKNLEPKDLGNGCKLMFQQSTSNPTQIRAVVKDAAGNIVSRGSVVDARTIRRSQFEAVAA